MGLPYRPCVGVMLVNPDGHVFVGKRLDNPADFWQMPQGGIDAGEEPQTAALRELYEETGVPADMVEVIGESTEWLTYDLPTELIGKIWKGKYRGQRQKWFLMRFTGADSAVKIDTEHAEFSDWRWSKREDVVAKIVPFKQAVYEQVVAEFSPKISVLLDQ